MGIAKVSILVVMCSALLMSCAYSRHLGNERLMNHDAASFIIKGKTTKSELIEKLGPPQTKQTRTIDKAILDNPNVPPMSKAPETWIYWSNNIEGTAIVAPFYAQTSHSSAMKTLTIFFDQQGNIVDYTSSETSM